MSSFLVAACIQKGNDLLWRLQSAIWINWNSLTLIVETNSYQIQNFLFQDKRFSREKKVLKRLGERKAWLFDLFLQTYIQQLGGYMAQLQIPRGLQPFFHSKNFQGSWLVCTIFSTNRFLFTEHVLEPGDINRMLVQINLKIGNFLPATLGKSDFCLISN